MTESDYENAPLEAPTEESDVPQSIPLDPGKLIDQLMRRYGAQNQQQVWENAQLATRCEALETLLAEANAEAKEADAAATELGQQCDNQQSYITELETALNQRMPVYLDSDGRIRPAATPADDPQEVDAFLAMASGQPGLASAPAPAESSATTPQP